MQRGNMRMMQAQKMGDYLSLLKVKKLGSKLHMHSVSYAAKLVHTRRILSSTIINFYLEPVSGQACNPPHPH
jgi:hypothetical protein